MVGLSLGLISAMSSWELPSILFQWCSHANTWLQACKVLYTDDCPHSMFHRNPASKGIPPRARHDDHHAASILILKATLPDWHRPPSLAFLSQERRKRRERNGCWFAFASASPPECLVRLDRKVQDLQFRDQSSIDHLVDTAL